MIIDGIKIKEDILQEVKKGVETLSFVPVFCDILVGNNPTSIQYVRMKEKMAESVGIKFREAVFNELITTEELIKEIENLNRVPHMCGIIVQLPLPDHIDTEKVLNTIDPLLDVDYLGFSASQKFYMNENNKGFPTALACMKILDHIGTSLSNKNIVVLGQGRLVGKPVTHLLTNLNLSVTTIDSNTQNINEIILNADIIISGIGKGKFINGNMVKKGVIIIDAGTSEDNGSIIGDVDLASVQNIASYVSPTPGGVGPVTVAFLLNNVLIVAKQK